MLKDEEGKFREWWAESGRLIDAPGAMAQRIMFAEKVWQAAIQHAQAEFKEAYSKYDEPLIGVMYGLKALEALAGEK